MSSYDFNAFAHQYDPSSYLSDSCMEKHEGYDAVMEQRCESGRLPLTSVQIARIHAASDYYKSYLVAGATASKENDNPHPSVSTSRDPNYSFESRGLWRGILPQTHPQHTSTYGYGQTTRSSETHGAYDVSLSMQQHDGHQLSYIGRSIEAAHQYVVNQPQQATATFPTGIQEAGGSVPLNTHSLLGPSPNSSASTLSTSESEPILQMFAELLSRFADETDAELRREEYTQSSLSSSNEETPLAQDPIDDLVYQPGLTERSSTQQLTSANPGSGKYKCIYPGCRGRVFETEDVLKVHWQSHFFQFDCMNPACPTRRASYETKSTSDGKKVGKAHQFCVYRTLMKHMGDSEKRKGHGESCFEVVKRLAAKANMKFGEFCKTELYQPYSHLCLKKHEFEIVYA